MCWSHLRSSRPSLLPFVRPACHRFLQGHVFCFTCVYEWVKTSAKCPTCRVEFKKITKTLTPVEIAKEDGRIEVRRGLRPTYSSCLSMLRKNGHVSGRRNITSKSMACRQRLGCRRQVLRIGPSVTALLYIYVG